MAKFCKNCGKPIIEGDRFCESCGAQIGGTSPSASDNTVKKILAPSNSNGKKSSKTSLFSVVLAVTLLIEAVVAAFWYPGFLKTDTTGGGSQEENIVNNVVVADDRGLSDEIPEITEPVYHSDPVDITPMEGLHVTAEANVLYEDTKLTVTPITEMSDYIAELDETLQEEGKYLFSMWEVDAGLEEGQVLPGEYKVSLDLEKMGVPESLYDYVCFIRVDDNGNMTELVSQVEGKTAFYYSDNNSIIIACVKIAAVGIVGAAAFAVGLYLNERSAKYSYYGYASRGYLEGNTEWGDYSVVWSAYEMDPDLSDKKDRLIQEEERLKQKAQEEYNKEEKLKKDTYGSLYWLFHKNLSVAERLKELKETDAQYQEIVNQIKLPDSIVEVANRIEIAFEYLATQAIFKMPKHRVEFFVKKKDKKDKDNLGGAQNGILIKTYVDIMIPHYYLMLDDDYESVEFRDNLLLTITHELGHVCQDRYHIGIMTDDNRFDEMVILVLESDAKKYYKEEGIITTDPKLTPCTNWATMICPIDQYVSGHNWSLNLLDNKHKFMQNQGYLLSTFVQFLRGKSIVEVEPRVLMRNRAYASKPDIQKVLMSSFKLSEKDFDKYFREWCVSDRMTFRSSATGDTGEVYAGARYDPMEIKYNTGEHFALKPKGHFSAPVRTFFPGEESAAVLLVYDKDLEKKHPEANIVFCENYKKTTNGAYIPAVLKPNGKPLFSSYNVIEVYGEYGKSTTFDGIGYTVYAITQPAQPTVTQDDIKLTIKLPKPVGAAADGAIDGIQVNITNDEKKTSVITVEKDKLGTEFSVYLSDVMPKGKNTGKLTVTLQEFVLDSEHNRLFMPASDPVEINVGSTDIIASGLVLERDSLSGLGGSILDLVNSHDDISNADPMPSDNTLHIEGDTMTLKLCGYNWKISGHDVEDKKVCGNASFNRSEIELKGEVVKRDEEDIRCVLTESPGEVSSSMLYHGTEREKKGDNIRYYDADLDERHTLRNIETNQNIRKSDYGSYVDIHLEKGNVTEVYVHLYGTHAYNITASEDGQSGSDSGEEEESFAIKLKKE